MTTQKMEQILLQLKWTLASTIGTPEARQVLALNQINNALSQIEQPYVLCVGRVEPGKGIVIKKVAG